MEPLTLATVITTAVFAGLTLILNIFQSFKEQHFTLSCSECCSLENEPEEKKEL